MNNRTTIMIALLVIAMMVGPASAISDKHWTDGNDEIVFVGEPVTITWSDPNSPTYILITNGAGAEIYSETCYPTGSGYTYECDWDTTNIAPPNDTQNMYVYLNTSQPVPSSPGTKDFTILMNNLSVSVTPDQAGVSALEGSNITVSLNTTGAAGPSYRAGAGFTIETNDTAAIVEQPTMNTTTGNGTGIVTPMTVDNGFTITVYTENSTKRVFTYNVSQLDVIALEVAASATNTNLTYVNVTDVNDANVDIDRDTNVTLTLDTTARPNDELNGSSGLATSMNIIILRGNDTTIGYGNITFPINASISGPTGGTGMITATTNTSTASWSTNYGVHPADEKITLNVDPASASVGGNISISGWIANPSATVCINITDANGIYVNNSTAIVRTLDGHYTYTWNTNDTWNTYYPFPSFTSPATFTILANSSDTGADNQTTTTVALSNDLTVEPNVTEAYIDQVVNITATSTRLNGTLVTINITDSAGRCVYFNDTHDVTNDVENTIGNWTWYLSAINASNPVPDLPSPPDGNRSINKIGTYTITLNDTATKVTNTILLNDELAVNAGTGVPGLNVTITGTSSRADGNTINVTIKGPSLIYEKTVTGTTYGYNATTHTSTWNATWKAVLDDDTSVGEGDYTATATDRIVTSSAAIYTLGTAIIAIEAPASAMVDDVIWINGTSNLEPGTNMLINITSGTKDINVSKLNATLQPDRTYSCAWTVNQSNASMYAAGFTQPSETYTITVSNMTDAGLVSKTAEIVVSDTLSLTNATGVPGDAITIFGTSNRINGTRIEVVVTATNYLKSLDGTVLNGEYTVTWTAKTDAGTNLPAGEYTVTANDTVVKVTGKATLSTAYVSLTQPESGDSFMVGTPVEMVGTTNRQNGTIINFRITGPNYVNDTISAIANVAGDFNVTWDTAGCATGDYYITAKNGTDESTVVAVTLTPVLTVDTIVVDPAGLVSLPNVTDTQQFNATCYNGTTELTGITVTWNSDNTTVGTIDASGLFTAVANGTTTITATAQGKSDTVTVTVGAAAVEYDSADTNHDCVVSLPEMMTQIGKWKSGTVEMPEMMTSIGRWKLGSGGYC